MGRLIDRLFTYLILGIFGLLLARIALGHAERLMQAVLAPFTGTFFGTVALLVITVLLAAGLCVRAVRAFTGSRGRGGRELAAEARQIRQSVRRPAQEVPVENRRSLPEDDDPAIGHEGD